MCLCLGKCVVRYILVSINLIFFLIGTVIAVVGGILLYYLRSSPPLDVKDYNLGLILVVVLGCVIALISAMGWCGACAERKTLLYIYSGLVLILVALQIYAVVKVRSEDTINGDLVVDSLEKAFSNSTQLQSFHALEVAFGCCGPYGPDSYAGVYDHLPLSCCLNATDIPDLNEPEIVDPRVDLMTLTCSADDAHPGCNEVLGDFVKMMAYYFGIGFIVVIAVELLAIVMAISLSCCIIAPKTV